MTLTIQDYQTAADKLGVELAAVRSVATVESNGKGFFQNGRPTILYERHIFYKQLLAKRNEAAKKAVSELSPNAIGAALDILTANALRSVKNEIDKISVSKPTICNPVGGGYLGGIKEYDRLNEAIKIDHECGLRSCSWGAFQIMGFHAESLGFKNVFEFVLAVEKSEANQLDIFARFIFNNSSLLKALKAKKWDSFARLYNGPAYATNKYDIKLAAAYNTFSNNPTLA